MLGTNTSTAKAVFLSFVLFVSVLAMPLTGTVAASSHHDDTITNNSEYEQGLVLLYSGATANTQVDLVQNGNTVATYTSNGSGEVWVETSSDDNGAPMEGTYSLVESGSTLVSFSVTDTSQYEEITASNDLFWSGQTLTFDNQSNFAAGEEVTLEVGGSGDDAGDFVQEYVVQNAGGEIVIDTDGQNLEGQYNIIDGSGTQVGSFEVVTQTLTVSAEEDQLSNEAAGDTDTTFNFDSNRAGYTVQVTEANSKLTSEEISTVFGGSVSQTDAATIDMDPSTTGDTSTHTVTADVSTAEALNGFSVDYSNSDADISNVGTGDVVKVGIDRDGDSSGSTIDVDVSDSLGSASGSNNGQTITFGFDGSYNLNAGDELVIVYSDVQNPTSQSETDVPVDINPATSGNTATASLYTTDSATEGAAYFRIDSTSSLNADFSSVEDGSYTFNFEVVDTGVSDTVGVGVDAQGDASVGFSQSVYSQHQGDVVNVTVNTDGATQFTVTFGDQESDNYSQTATVDVDSGVSEVKLQFNTYEAGTGATPWSLHEDSVNDASLSQSTDTDLSGDQPIDAGDYDLEASITGNIEDTGLVTLTEGTLNGATTHTAPTTSNINELEDLEAATESSTVAMEDKFVFEVDASGVYGFINEDTTAADLKADDDDDATDGSFDDKHGVYVMIEETEPEPNTAPDTLDVSQGTLITDPANDTFYLVFDESDFAEVAADDEFKLSFHQTEKSVYVENSSDADNSEEVSSNVTFVEREYTFNGMNEDNVVEVSATSEAQISGTTTVAPGTEVTILAQSGSPNAFTKTATMEVTADRTFAAIFDMSDANEGQEFELTLRDVGKTVDAVAVGGTQPTSTLTVNVEDTNGEAVNADVTVDGQTKTATDGTATFDLANGDYSVNAVADGYINVGKTVTVEGDTSVTLTLEEVQTVDYTVTVQDSNGEAVSGASVTVDGQTKTTDSSGQATFTLAEGSYTAQVSANGYQGASSSITVSSDSTSTTVALSAEQTEYTQTFTVEDSNGEAVSGATVEFNGQTKTTGENGEVTFTTTEGEYDVTVSADGYEGTSETVTVSGDSSTTLTITASDAGGDGQDGDGQDGDGAGGDSDGGLPLGLIGAVVVILALLGVGGYFYTQNQN